MMKAANTILEHLGGEHFIRMAGAESICAGSDFLSISLPDGHTKNGVNRVKISVDPSATYRVEARKMNWLQVKISVIEQHQVQGAELLGVFSRMIGLDATA